MAGEGSEDQNPDITRNADGNKTTGNRPTDGSSAEEPNKATKIVNVRGKSTSSSTVYKKTDLSGATKVCETDPCACVKCLGVGNDTNPMMLKCEICGSQCCKKCTKLSGLNGPTKMEVMNRDDVAWFCSTSCKEMLTAPLKIVLGKLEECMIRITSLETKISEQADAAGRIHPLVDNICKLGDQVGIIEDKIDGIYKNQEAPYFSESLDIDDTAVKRTFAAVTGKGTNMKGIVREAIQEQEKESQDKDERATNVIIFRVKESNEKERKKREEADKTFIQGFIDEIGISDIGFDRITRLGKKEEGKDRPLRFRVEDLKQKAEIMDHLYRLREAEAPYSKTSVRHDLTPSQREEFRELTKEARQQTSESEGFLFRVQCNKGPHWEPRIVKRKAPPQ